MEHSGLSSLKLLVQWKYLLLHMLIYILDAICSYSKGMKICQDSLSNKYTFYYFTLGKPEMRSKHEIQEGHSL